jgi:hypothetical protein
VQPRSPQRLRWQVGGIHRGGRTWHTPKPKGYPVVRAHASPKAAALLVENIAAKGGSPEYQVRSARFALRAPVKNPDQES